MLNDGQHNYTYDAENRLIQVDGGNTATYTYGSLGQRVEGPNGDYIYDLGGNMITQIGLNNVWNYGEIYAGGRHIATYSGATTNFFGSDWLGTKRAMTGLGETLSQTCTGFPFGDGVNCTGGNISFNLFTDDVHDPETNLEHTWFRKYSSAMGRWLTPDPAGMAAVDPTSPQSLNRYAYVGNNPINGADPFGLLCMKGVMCSSPGDGGIFVPVFVDFGGFIGIPVWVAVGQTVTGGPDGTQDVWGTSVPGVSDLSYADLGFGIVPVMSVTNVAFGTASNNPTFFFPPRTCTGTARVLGGAPATVGQQGGVPGTPVAAGSAAAIPRQFGFRTGSGFSGTQITGTVGYWGPLGWPGSTQSFSGITDVIGNNEVRNVRSFLMKENPGALILELVTGKDMGTVPVQITIPGGMSCPAGTK